MLGKIGGRKQIVLALACSGILLGACGNRAEEVYEAAEEEEEILEVSEEASEPSEEISLTDLTWDDFNDRVGDTVLHFTFSNGTIVDQVLPMFMTVESVAYKDMTDDGIDEVIVSGYFLNTATEYHVMDFFRIEEDAVTKISPSTNIPELADGVFETEVVNDPAEGYTMVLTMKSYAKVPALAYKDMEMTVGYDGEGWKVIQQWEMPEWRQAYLEYLCFGEIRNPASEEMERVSEYIFGGSLIYIDEDDIPELLYKEIGGNPGLLIYRDEEVVDLGTLGRAEVWYQEKTGRVATYYEAVGGSSWFYEYRLADGKQETMVSANADVITPEMNLDRTSAWYWNDAQISQEEYEQQRDEILDAMTLVENQDYIIYDELCLWLMTEDGETETEPENK